MTKKEREKELRCYSAALTAASAAEILHVSIKSVYKPVRGFKYIQRRERENE